MTIDVGVIWQFVERFGLPVTMFAVILWTGARGIWVFSREMVNAALAHEAQTALLQAQVSLERAERTRAEAKADRWEGIALDAIIAAKTGTEALKAVMREKGSGSP